jgi:hypothetical protein
MERAVPAGLAGRLFGRHPEARLALLRAAWANAVGPDLARRTEVLALEGQMLRIRVPDARWRKVLHRMQSELLPRLRQFSGDGAPRRLGFTEGGIVETAAVTALSPRTAGAPEAAPPEAVRAAADQIADPELRLRFLETASRYLASRRHHA